jgi:hypothetical protein
MATLHLERSRSWWRCRKRVIQLTPTCKPHISEAKFRIIVLVGGRALAVRSSIYCTSSASCCGLSNCWCSYPSVLEPVRPLHLLLNVERSTPWQSATSLKVNFSSSSRDSRSAIASSIGAMVVEISRVEVEVRDGVVKFTRARAHRVHEPNQHGIACRPPHQHHSYSKTKAVKAATVAIIARFCGGVVY